MTEEMSKFIVIIRPEFMCFCKDACRAASFNHLLFRIAGKCKDQSKEKIQDGKILWYANNEQITEEMSNAWGVCKVRQEINDLVTMGIIGRTKDPNWGVNRTKHFFFGSKQCATFLQFCEEHNICFVHLDLPDEVKHLIYSSNANDKSIKCICGIHQMQAIDLSDANDKSIEAITKIDYKEIHKEDNKEEREEVATATARSQSSSQDNLSQDDETVKREAVKPSQKEVVRGHHQHRASDNHLPADSHQPEPSQPEHRKDTNKVTEPPAPRKPRSNPTIPKRPRPQQQELTDEIPGPEIPEKAIAIMDRWDRVHKKPAPRTIKTIQAAQLLMVYDPSEDELRECEKWLYTTDRPGKPWYRSHGVHLPDIAEKIGSWQSLQNAPPAKPEKEPSNEHKASSFYTLDAYIERQNQWKTEGVTS